MKHNVDIFVTKQLVSYNLYD